METRRKDYCTECRKKTYYDLKTTCINKTIRDKSYPFAITTAVCAECGAEMSIPGLLDWNVQEIDSQYRMAEGLVTVADINRLMELYNIGKAPLSLALGFGEVTITRYLAGQVPSREYSDIIRHALESPAFMKEALINHQMKINTVAYNKAMLAIRDLEQISALSEKIQQVIGCLFLTMEEITPLMLQKLLYYTQGLAFARTGRPMFPEQCEAWTHGPVYRKVYDIFKGFKYDPIDDARFSIFKEKAGKLDESEQEIVHLVAVTFGMYGGKTLETLTHREGSPWRQARAGIDDGILSEEVIPMDAIKEYFLAQDRIYRLSEEAGVRKYIAQTLGI